MGDATPPWQPTATVPELLTEQFLQCHIETLQLWISLSRLHEQRERTRRDRPPESVDETDAREEFERELGNLHALLVNPHQQCIDVLRTAQNSIRAYLALWPGSADAVDRWWTTPRADLHAAVHADLHYVVPGLWLGSATTLTLANAQLLEQQRIRHIVRCECTPVDADDDFLRGTERALATDGSDAAGSYPILHTVTNDPAINAIQHHCVTLFQFGRMEFRVRRRELTIPAAATTHAIHTVCQYLHPLFRRLRDQQYDRELVLRVERSRDTSVYVDQFDGILLYCETGTTASIVVGIALLLTELRVPYAVAQRLVANARPYVAPSEYFQHALCAYEAWLRAQGGSQNLSELNKLQ